MSDVFGSGDRLFRVLSSLLAVVPGVVRFLATPCRWEAVDREDQEDE